MNPRHNAAAWARIARTKPLLIALAPITFLTACSGQDRVSLVDPIALDAASPDASHDGTQGGGSAHADSGTESPLPGADDAGATSDAAIDATIPDAAASDLVAALTAITSNCTVASKGKLAKTEGAAPTVDICALKGAYFYKSDMGIDCDGQPTPECNKTVDPYFQAQTAFTQRADGKPLVAAKLPYIVLPLASAKFNYATAQIKPGALAIVLYAGKLSYGVFGDLGPQGAIGEASYAMAKSIGIDPDPVHGGVDDGVTYIVFSGQAAAVTPIEDPSAAIALGEKLARALVAASATP